MGNKVLTQLVIEGINKSKKAFQEVNKDLDLTAKASANAGKAIAGFLSVGALAVGVKLVANTADAYQLMNARLKLATGSQEEFNVAQKDLQRIAAATSSPVESLITLYSRISRPLREAGRSQKDILGVTEAVATAFKVSGASADEAENGVVQFAQALGSGALRGDEFNSVAEQAPRLMQALADGIGVPVGALKEMASQGQLTASVVTDALLGQLPKLQQELSGFGDTVGGQLVQIEDVLKRGVGQAATGPLIEALKELKGTLEDPVIMQNLTNLAGALIKVAEAAAKGGSAFVEFANDLGYLAARAAGSVEEMDRVNKEIEYLEAASGSKFGVLDLYMSNDDIAAKLAEFKAYREQLLEQQTGMNAEARKAAEDAANQIAAVESARHEASLQSEQAYVDSLIAIRDQQVVAKEAALKREEAAEKQAKSSIERIRKDRLAIERRYSQAIAEINAGAGAGDPSYSGAQALKVGAQAALRSGDLEGAKAQAQAALKMLQDLAAAGENTYGFTGFIEGLRGIELQANDIEKSQADDKLQSITARMVEIKEQAAALQNLPITLNLAPEEIERVKTELQALAGAPIIIPVQLGPTPEMAAIGLQGGDPVTYPVSGYATGTNSATPGVHWVGENGPELMAFNGGEKVFTAAASANLAAKLAGMQIPQISDASMIEAAMSASGSQASRDLGTLNIHLPDGGVLSAKVAGDGWDELRKASVKYGRSNKR